MQNQLRPGDMHLVRRLSSWFVCFAAAFSVYAVEEVISPRSTFKIHQQQHDENWSSVLHFTKGSHQDVTLTDTYPWPALFYVSSDDEWILQIQKSGSGDNVSFLYHLEPDGRLWRMQQEFGELAFSFLERSLGIRVADLYHTGIQFRAWDLKKGVLRFSIRGGYVNQSGKGIDRELIYDLKGHSFRIAE